MSNISLNSASLTQSPVNISTDETPTKSLNQVLELNYKNDTIAVINNGSNIDGDFESKENFVVYQKDKYFLEGIHLHTKSEHTFDGKNTDGEIHLVHKTTSGEILVVGMLLEAVNNGALVNTQVDSFLQRIDSSLKDTSKTIEDLSFDPSQLISNTTEVYNFGGSLTTTPFSDATWVVSSEILKVNQDGLQKFSKLQDEFYGNNGINNRDPQNELYLGTDGKDKIFGDRNGASADIIYGNDGNDFLKGFEADDKIFGNEGDDTLKGGFGDDLLLDNEGNDYLEGN